MGTSWTRTLTACSGMPNPTRTSVIPLISWLFSSGERPGQMWTFACGMQLTGTGGPMYLAARPRVRSRTSDTCHLYIGDRGFRGGVVTWWTF